MARQSSPSRATKALLHSLRAQGVTCSARQLEDWSSVGLVPRGQRRSLGRGRGTEVVYPPEMEERCRLVAERMRRGQAWQIVALGLFAAGVDLPDATVRSAYRWAHSIESAPGGDELDAAERGVEHFVRTGAGRRLASLMAAHIKRSGVAGGEPASSVATGVLVNVFLISLGGEPANDAAVIELLAGLGIPIQELPANDQLELAGLMGRFLSSFSLAHLTEVVDRVPISDLRDALPFATAMLDLLPEDIRSLMPASLSELLPVLLVPLLIRLREVAVELGGPPSAYEAIEDPLAAALASIGSARVSGESGQDSAPIEAETPSPDIACATFLPTACQPSQLTVTPTGRSIEFDRDQHPTPCVSGAPAMGGLSRRSTQ